MAKTTVVALQALLTLWDNRTELGILLEYGRHVLGLLFVFLFGKSKVKIVKHVKSVQKLARFQIEWFIKYILGRKYPRKHLCGIRRMMQNIERKINFTSAYIRLYIISIIKIVVNMTIREKKL